jgi:hypothetical protein
VVNIYVTTRQYMPEDSKLHTRRRENLKSHNFKTCSLICISLTNPSTIQPGTLTTTPTCSCPVILIAALLTMTSPRKRSSPDCRQCCEQRVNIAKCPVWQYNKAKQVALFEAFNVCFRLRIHDTRGRHV